MLLGVRRQTLKDPTFSNSTILTQKNNKTTATFRHRGVKGQLQDNFTFDSKSLKNKTQVISTKNRSQNCTSKSPDSLPPNGLLSPADTIFKTNIVKFSPDLELEEKSKKLVTSKIIKYR